MELPNCSSNLRSISSLQQSSVVSRTEGLRNDISLNDALRLHQSSSTAPWYNSTRVDMNGIVSSNGIAAIPFRSFSSTHFNESSRPGALAGGNGGRSILSILDEAINISDEVLSLHRSRNDDTSPMASSRPQQDTDPRPNQ